MVLQYHLKGLRQTDIFYLKDKIMQSLAGTGNLH